MFAKEKDKALMVLSGNLPIKIYKGTQAPSSVKLGGFGNGTRVKVEVVVVKGVRLEETPEFACFVKTVPLVMGKGVATTVKFLNKNLTKIKIFVIIYIQNKDKNTFIISFLSIKRIKFRYGASDN